MLEKAGFKQSDIPTKWADYWSFWCDKVQPAIRKAAGQRVFGIGQPMGVESTDSLQSFYTFMDAYNVKLVDDDGKLLVDDPKVREGLIHALKDYTDIYIKGCTPPSSTTWKDPDNNVAFHNKTTVMTHNFTISIAAKWLDDSNNPALTAEQRAAGKKAYEEDIITASFPNKPDGTPIKYRSDVKTGVIFAVAKNKAKAKEFVKFLLQEEKPAALCRGRARPLVSGDDRRPEEPVLAGRPPPQGGLQPVHRRHTTVRLHQELQVHHPQQRERLGQGDEPRGQREGAGGQGRR
jgi:multiple sugar transport system substrate-binding protein